MKWRVEFRPQVERDVAEAADWYEARQSGLGVEFVEEVVRVWDALAENPLLNCRRHPTKNIRWRFSDRFPYRIIYEVVEPEQIVIVAAVLHAARHDSHWSRRILMPQRD
jgi:plasmid stabilization system protein ParE